MAKKKPSNVHLLNGNPGKRKINKSEPQPKKKLPSCPAHLSGPAKTEWKRISKELYVLGLLTNIDRAALAAYCQAWGRWVTSENNIKKKGVVLKGAKGGYYQNPHLSIANRAIDLMYKFLTEFGMTPSARTKIEVKDNPNDKEESDWDVYS